jgi:diguanylate cyclase (GGDEF)-like protein
MNKPTDNMTGLILGKEFNGEMELLIAKGNEFAFILLDLDEFKKINDNFGHGTGDEVIKLVAKNIKNLFPGPCLAFRIGGEEFGVLIPDSSKEQAFLKAEELRKAICEDKLDYALADGTPLKQSASIGVASYPDDGSRSADIYRRADSAMVRAKKEGRNIVCLAREEKLLPKTSHYTQAQLEKLSLISEKINVGEAALLREALDDLLRKYNSTLEQN